MDTNRAELRLPNCLDSNLERVRYFQSQLLTVEDMQVEQNYFREKQRRHNRYLHGWGSVCGLEVVPALTRDALWRVEITPGYALGPFGDEIHVPNSCFLDLAQCGPGAMTDPCDPNFLRRPTSTASRQVFVAIKYAECLARPVRVMPAGCACEEEACEYSRIRDSYECACLDELPPSHQPSPGPHLCDIIQGRQLPDCLPCSTEPWVVLAQVNLPAPSTEIAVQMIDNFTFRRQVFSTAVLQEQLIRCCCEPGASADLVASVSISQEPTPLFFNSSITVTNNGPSTAVNVTLLSSLSTTNGAIQIVNRFEATRGAWTNTQFEPLSNNAQFTASIDNLAAGEVAIFSFGCEMTARNTIVIHRAEVSSDTPDPDSTNNSATARFPRLSPGGGNFVNPV